MNKHQQQITDFNNLFKTKLKYNFSKSLILLNLSMLIGASLSAMYIFFQPPSIIMALAPSVVTQVLGVSLTYSISKTSMSTTRIKACYLYHSDRNNYVSDLMIELINAILGSLIVVLAILVTVISKDASVLTTENMSNMIISVIATLFIYLLIWSFVQFFSSKVRSPTAKRTVGLVVGMLFSLVIIISPIVAGFLVVYNQFLTSSQWWFWLIPVLNILLALTPTSGYHYLIFIPIIYICIFLVATSNIFAKSIKTGNVG